MKKPIIPILVLIGLLAVLPPAHAGLPGQGPTTGSTLFWDDFVTSGFPSQWIDQQQIVANPHVATQAGGYFTQTVLAQSFVTQSIIFITVSTLGNQSSTPVFGSLTPETVQFVQIVVKTIAFNFTSPTATDHTNGAPVPVLGIMEFGLGNMTAPINVGGGIKVPGRIYFSLWGSNTVLSKSVGAAFPAQKQAVYLMVDHPMSSATKTLINCQNGAACGTSGGILYNGGNSPIDLTAIHTYTMQVQIDKGNDANTWARIQVDNFGWMQVTQTACSCITGATGDISKLYPFIDTSAGEIATVNYPIMSQSIASQTDFVLVTNYVPPTLPTGQLLVSNIHPPTKLPQPYNAFGTSDSITAFIQFYANQLGGGNIYAGGLFLSGMILTILGGTIGGIIYKSRRGGIRELGFMWTLSGLGIVFFMFYCGVVPLWFPVIQTVLAAGIVFGVVSTGKGSSGGFVPD